MHQYKHLLCDIAFVIGVPSSSVIPVLGLRSRAIVHSLTFLESKDDGVVFVACCRVKIEPANHSNVIIIHQQHLIKMLMEVYLYARVSLSLSLSLSLCVCVCVYVHMHKLFIRYKCY